MAKEEEFPKAKEVEKELEETQKAAEEAGDQEEDKLQKSEELFKQYESGMQGKAASLEEAAKARLGMADAGVAAALGQQMGGTQGLVGGAGLRQAASAAESAQRQATLESAQLGAQAADARAKAAMGIQEAGIVAGAASEAQLADMKTGLSNAINEAIAANKGGTFEDDDEQGMYNDMVQYATQEHEADMGGNVRDFPKYENLSPGDPDPNNPGKTVTAYQIAVAKELRRLFTTANDILRDRKDV